MSDPVASRRVELLLGALGADAYLREVVLGDLAEEFALRVSRDGPRPARRWYYRESLRVAPFLLRDWWRRLRANDVGSLAAVVVLSSMFLVALELFLQFAVRGLEGALGGRHGPLASMHRAAPGVAALMLAWTAADGVAAGYVAARLGRRAPLPSAVALGVTWIGVMVLTQGQAVPLWFRAANAATLLIALVAGAVACACSVAARRVSISVEPFPGQAA